MDILVYCGLFANQKIPILVYKEGLGMGAFGIFHDL
jgi:hypothetical protein